MDKHISKYFKYLNHALLIGIIAIMYFTFLRLFAPAIPVISGPFPDRVRGPLASPEYYELGALPEWEYVLDQTDAQGRTLPHALIGPLAEVDIPVLEFEEPPAVPADEETAASDE